MRVLTMNIIKIVSILAVLTCVSCHEDLLGEESCGKFPKPRVIDGAEAKKGDWPSMVAIYKKRQDADSKKKRLRDGSELVCGGTLISENYVLTAASCFDNDNADYYAEAGRHDLWNPDKYVQHKTFEIIKHPQHRGALNDIALLKLDSSISFSKRVKPACLPAEEDGLKKNTITTVVGWGGTKDLGDGYFKYTDVLRQGAMPVVSLKHCKKLYSSRDIDEENNFCSGSGDGSQTACGLDSGGPLFVRRESRWFTYGIPTLFTGHCDSYVLGTRTNVYASWIKQTVTGGEYASKKRKKSDSKGDEKEDKEDKEEKKDQKDKKEKKDKKKEEKKKKTDSEEDAD